MWWLLWHCCMWFPTYSENEAKAKLHHMCSCLFFLLSNGCCFPLIQSHSDMCGFHWTVCVLGNGLEVSLPFASLARKRQTSEIRHLFHLADPVEGLEGQSAYITKTNIQHFRGLHHNNRIKLALVALMCWEGAAGQLLGERLVENHSAAAALVSLTTSRMIKRCSTWRHV